MTKKNIFKLLLILIIFSTVYVIQTIGFSLARYVVTKNIDVPIYTSDYYVDIEAEEKVFNSASLSTNIIMKNSDGTQYMLSDLEYTISMGSDKFDVVLTDSANGEIQGGSEVLNVIPVTVTQKALTTLDTIETANVNFNITYPYEDVITVIFVYIDYITDNLKLYFDGINNTGSGYSSTATVWKDLIANNDGTVLGTSSWDGLGFTFNGSTKIALGGDITSTYTMSFVILPVQTGQYPRIVGEAAAGSTGNPLFPGIYLTFANSYKLGFYGQGKDATFTNSSPPSTINKTTVTITYDGANAKLYMNGIYVDQVATVIPPTPESVMYLGGNGSTNRYYTGKIYNFMMYGKPLSPQEVLHNYGVDQVRFQM